MGTEMPRNSTRGADAAANNDQPGTRTDAIGQALAEVIERERRNLQRASAVLASLIVAVMYEDELIAADDVADVAREVIDKVTDALGLVRLEKAAQKDKAGQPP